MLVVKASVNLPERQRSVVADLAGGMMWPSRTAWDVRGWSRGNTSGALRQPQ